MTTVATPARGFARERLRSTSTWIVLSIALAALTTFLMWPTGSSLRLDPDNQQPGGSRALAQVAAQHGVRIHTVRKHDDLVDATSRLSGPTTLVVSDSGQSYSVSGKDLLALLPKYRHVVLVGLPQHLLKELDLPVDVRGTPTTVTTLHADCAAPVMGQAEQIDNPRELVQLSPSTADRRAEECFRSDSASALLVVAPQRDLPEIAVLTAEDAFTNEDILRQSHAVLALRLVTQDPNVVWYSPAAQFGVDRSVPQVASLWPPWSPAALLMIGVTVAGAMLWRGRRLGRLVIEPLPVVVKAAETTRSRARLYFASDDTAHGASVLQEATRSRLRSRLALPPDADASTMIRAVAVAAATGRPPEQIGALLYDTRNLNDTALVNLANALASLEKEVARP